MQSPAIHRLGNQVEAAAKRLHRQTDHPVIIVATSPAEAEEKGAVFYIAGVTNSDHEMAVVALLDALEKDAQEGAAAGCPDCMDRLARVAAALAVLRPEGDPTDRPKGHC